MEMSLTDQEIKEILSSRKMRSELAYRSHEWFFHVYFNHYVKHPTADFQKELFRITEDKDNLLAVIVSFRGSAKSTIMSLSYPIWAILGEQQKKFIVIASQTQQQARLMMANIRQELETNELLRKDMGPFREESNEWGSLTLYLPKFNARIVAVSAEQSIRGVRNKENRPDLIIVDDAEDITSTKTREGRSKTYNWFMGDLLPTGDDDTKVIVIGNLLHEDSLLMRLQERMKSKEMDGIYRNYPLVDGKGKSLWPGKYPNKKSLKKLKKKVGDIVAWKREFLLMIVPDDDQVIDRKWIQYYDSFPKGKDVRFSKYLTGVDLAISEKDRSDYTALVSGALYSVNSKPVLYILPNPIYKRMNFRKTIEEIKNVSLTLGDGYTTKMLVESVGYQQANAEQLKAEGIDAEAVRIGSMDKRTRLALTANKLADGKIMFPRKGCEALISNMVHFGVEKHDDLTDAFTLLANYSFANFRVPFDAKKDMFFVGGSPDDWDDDDDDEPFIRNGRGTTYYLY